MREREREKKRGGVKLCMLTEEREHNPVIAKESLCFCWTVLSLLLSPTNTVSSL